MNDQQAYMEYMNLNQQIQQIGQQLQAMEQNHQELEFLKDSIKQFNGLKKGDSIMAPIANGMFIDVSLNDNAKIKVNVGGNTIVTKTTDEVIEMLSEQEQELIQFKNKAREDYAKAVQRLKEIELEVQKTMPEHTCSTDCNHD